MKQQQTNGQSNIEHQNTPDALKVARSNGAYLLNPSGDLKNTQRNFEQSLEALPGWEGLVEQKPQESDFKSYIADKSTFLYFGHGSGGQYIRSRTVKKLERCAVTILMGCSSGLMNEVGEYEAYGPPLDYMQAGSPALLANLWDVTDKDIDRFTQSVLEKWGLFHKHQEPALSSPVKRKGKGKFRAKSPVVADVHENDEQPVSLDIAVARSRSQCILKYLNGAAPVIYGIPVCLD